MKKHILTLTFVGIALTAFSQAPQEVDTRHYDIVEAVSADRIENDIRTLAGFGTRNTFSDTVSNTRGIGAARRWIKAEFDKISEECGGCLEVFYQKDFVTKEGNSRVPKDAWVVNVVAIQKGTDYPNNHVLMSGDIDSRASNTMDYETDAPGANDNASGMAGTIEAARVLSKYKFKNSIVYVGLSGEEQGLFGGAGLAEYAKENEWNIIGILNNDMIGNIEGVDGVIDNRTFRIFSEPVPPTETERERTMRRYYGGEVDGISRQLARYVHKQTQTYMPEMNPMMIYRLDRFGRGGHHRPFNDLGFAGIRIMEAHENYNRQHQDIRVEDGIEYGDVVEGVNFDYAKKLTAVNAISLAGLAWAPPAPQNVGIGGVVAPSAILAWDEVDNDNIVGYKIYWRLTTSPTWDNFRYVGKVNEHTLEGIVIDNYYFGVSAVDKNGNESVVVFPDRVIR
ncbi:peptidase M28 [Marivirga tractuosa]|uniref:Peptidase M28 n=1 Tax=Marivirga tractuosa (strain ATCC 23168 / DSM 4126 / NBRC 15989 / NCIMB 1408 / VKM B-1430 / H-43) TaxID=643867 RepID=E4TSX7_MARTH|nr:M28 family peptidase [Marivirga tractuosa]ADR22918.1 peptidase M28 [Marivirga tractuosa DSM 4126]BDD16408.1 peptidase M28 [Marivirga tractuosa]